MGIAESKLASEQSVCHMSSLFFFFFFFSSLVVSENQNPSLLNTCNFLHLFCSVCVRASLLQGSVDGITTISRKTTEIDPLLQRLQGLEIVSSSFHFVLYSLLPTFICNFYLIILSLRKMYIILISLPYTYGQSVYVLIKACFYSG